MSTRVKGRVISAVTLSGFKSFRTKTRLELRPLTILAGPNSSGKSSAMQPLLLVKQTLEAPFDPGPLLLGDGHVQVSDPAQIINKPEGDRGFSIGFELSSREAFVSTFIPDKRRGVALEETTYQFGEPRFTVSASGYATQAVHQFVNGGAKRRSRRSAGVPRKLQQRLEEIPELENWVGEANRCFLVPRPKWSRGEHSDSHFFIFSVGNERLDFLQRIPRQFAVAALDLIHVPGLRGNPLRSYPAAGAGPRFAGSFQNYTASVIAAWQEPGNKPHLKHLGEQLKQLGLTWKVAARRINATDVELQVGRLGEPRQGGARDVVNIADVGFGVSQVLPVLVALQLAEPGRCVYLEQPEIHLHPRAQAALGEILVESAVRGVRVVAETHSSLLLRSVQTLVAAGRIPEKDVALHWFQRDDTGESHVTTAELGADGSYGQWPSDFEDVELESHDRYLSQAKSDS